MFGPSIGGILYDQGGFKLPFFFLGGFSILIGAAAVLLFSNESTIEDDQNDTDKVGDVTWMMILKSSGVMQGLLGTTIAATGWQWYAASLEVHFKETFQFSSTSTGLVLMAFGVSYTIATPLVGFLTDKGLSKYLAMILGNLVITVAFIFLGPSPPLDFIDKFISVHILCFIGQGRESISFDNYGIVICIVQVLEPLQCTWALCCT